MLTNKRVLITGGTGSIGTMLVKRLLGGALGMPREVIVFSRDEAKQHAMRVAIEQRAAGVDEDVYRERARIRYHIGDIANYSAVVGVLRRADVVFHTAALKQVPTAELFPSEAVRTNITGVENIVRAIRDHGLPIEAVIGISTDKACKPVNVMGMTKALQERILIGANLECPQTRFVIARYGNVLASRGSVVPLFHQQIQAGGPVTITSAEMTRFLMSMNQAVDTILAALVYANPGEIFVPQIASCYVTDLARALIGERNVEMKLVGMRSGEKIHETLVAEEEAARTGHRNGYYAVAPMAPELRVQTDDIPYEGREYSSSSHLMSQEQLDMLLRTNNLMLEDVAAVREI